MFQSGFRVIGKKLSQHDQEVRRVIGPSKIEPQTDVGDDHFADGFWTSPQIHNIAGKKHTMSGGWGRAQDHFVWGEPRELRALLDGNHHATPLHAFTVKVCCVLV